MSAVKRVPHPSGSVIQFDPKWHQYKLGYTALRSVSKLLDGYFPFDESRILQLVSKKTGEPVDQVKRGWMRQALLGKNVHEFIECRLLDKPPPTFTLLMESRARRAAQRPEDATGPSPTSPSNMASQAEAEMLHGEESMYIPAAEQAVQTIKSHYEVIAVEQVIASPDWGLAGTIDLVARNKKNNNILIGDWKTSGSVISNFRFGSFESACLGCLRHLPNSKFYRYAAQVIVYGEILKHAGYFEKNYFANTMKGSPQTSAELQQKTEKKKRATAKNAKAVSAGLVAHSIGATPPLEYGIVQLSKDESGGVVVEFKEVTEQTVLPPDIPEQTFTNLLQDVMLRK